MDGSAPPVRFEACEQFRPDRVSARADCRVCGWLEDDHTRPVSAGAVVAQLPRRGAVLPERKAS
jgi:hypothetical protein